MAGRSFPTTPDELTDAWLGEVTGVAGDWRLEPLTGGFWSSMVRAVADDGSSVVVKFADPSDQARFVCDLFDFNRVEVGFYRDLAADAPVRVPRPIHVAHTDDHAEYVIVMDDLSDLETHNQLDGCPLDVAERVVDALATLHAHHLGRPELDEVAWLHHTSAPLLVEQVPMIVAGLSEQAFANLPDAPSEIVAAWPRVLAALPHLLDDLDPAGTTLVHGDVRLQNLFFADDGDVAFVDWQVVRHTHGAYDLAYFLTQSLAADDRRSHEATLLARYADRLHKLGGPEADDAALLAAYRRCALYCTIYPIIAASNADAAGNTEAMAIAARAFDAVLDLDALSLI